MIGHVVLAAGLDNIGAEAVIALLIFGGIVLSAVWPEIQRRGEAPPLPEELHGPLSARWERRKGATTWQLVGELRGRRVAIEGLGEFHPRVGVAVDVPSAVSVMASGLGRKPAALTPSFSEAAEALRIEGLSRWERLAMLDAPTGRALLAAMVDRGTELRGGQLLWVGAPGMRSPRALLAACEQLAGLAELLEAGAAPGPALLEGAFKDPDEGRSRQCLTALLHDLPSTAAGRTALEQAAEHPDPWFRLQSALVRQDVEALRALLGADGLSSEDRRSIEMALGEPLDGRLSLDGSMGELSLLDEGRLSFSDAAGERPARAEDGEAG